MSRPDDLDEVREQVRARYAGAATAVTEGGVATCGDTCRSPAETGTGAELYSAAGQGELPGDAVSASLGCGNPLAVADLRVTGEMLDLARASAAHAGAANVEFLQGHIEAIPLPDAAADVIISNCVINLSGDKAAVFAESFRVLRPGGRFGISDILAEDGLTAAERLERGRPVGCLAGLLSFTEYHDGLTQAGFTSITITPTHEVTHGLHSATVQATRP